MNLVIGEIGPLGSQFDHRRAHAPSQKRGRGFVSGLRSCHWEPDQGLGFGLVWSD